MLADLGGGAAFCQPSILARVASPHLSDGVTRLPPAEGQRNGRGMPERELSPLVAARQMPYFLLPFPLVHAASSAPVFGMLCNWRPVPQNMRQLSPVRNESVPEGLSAVP